MQFLPSGRIRPGFFFKYHATAHAEAARCLRSSSLLKFVASCCVIYFSLSEFTLAKTCIPSAVDRASSCGLCEREVVTAAHTEGAAVREGVWICPLLAVEMREGRAHPCLMVISQAPLETAQARNA